MGTPVRNAKLGGPAVALQQDCSGNALVRNSRGGSIKWTAVAQRERLVSKIKTLTSPGLSSLHSFLRLNLSSTSVYHSYSILSL